MPVGDGNTPQGPAGPCPAAHGGSARPPRRARSPALHCGRKGAATRKRRPSLRPDGGPMQASAPAQECAAAGRVQWPGRVFPRVLQGVWWPGGCGGPEGYLQSQVRHPSVACGDTSPCRGGFWGVRRPAVPGFAARVPYAVGRAFTPAGEACGGGGTAGLCKTPSHKAYESTRPRGGRERPPYIAAENGRQSINGRHLQRPTAGRCKHRPLRRGGRWPKKTPLHKKGRLEIRGSAGLTAAPASGRRCRRA